MTCPALGVALLLAAFALAGCATGNPGPDTDHRPRAVCLDEPTRGPASPYASTRPLFFLFCIQTP